MTRISFPALLLALIAATPASAEMIEKTGRFGGLQVTYKVVLPAGYKSDESYPAVLVFTGGAQQLRGAESTLIADWRDQAETRGYIVISPGTPNGSLFFEDADRIFPEFLDMIVRDYKVAGGKLHIAGHSNGGLSAFHVAAKYPNYFKTLTGYPGLLDGQSDLARMQVLKPLCIFMHVGEQDEGWKSAMQQQAEKMRRDGYKVRFAVEKNQVHRIKAQEVNLSPRLFDQIDSCP